jgi:5-methylcytosine-specific restriction endonuclease McrA
MAADHSSDRWGDQNDPFGEEPYLMPHEDELRERAKQVLRDNRDALRHFVELATWGTLDQPDLRTILITLLLHWKDIDPKWVAEASYMSTADVYNIAEAESLMVFPCLGCGAELLVRHRLHSIRLHRSIEEYCGDESASVAPAELLCETCHVHRDTLHKQQRRLDRERYEAILADYRERPYEVRRDSREWAILKRQVHTRDEYRCRLCGRSDVALHVHHSTYENYAKERLEDLITLCAKCHSHFHFGAEAS